jgi:hypothetical protein
MKFFARKPRAARPPETLRSLNIQFVGEQAGPVENDLKAKFQDLLAQTTTVRAAYLAQVSYGNTPDHSVVLCIRSTVGIDESLQKYLGLIFTKAFRPDQHLDILFIRDDQEEELRKVCKPFYETDNTRS